MTQEQPLWTPISQQNNATFVAGQGMVPAKRINFKLYDGTLDYVDIPLADLSPDVAEELIHAAATRHAQIMGLTGPTLAELPAYEAERQARHR
jgi:hypothetical protein